MITIDWGTKIIYVPKADLTLIQSTPTEIRELDLNWFRLQLKDLEDSEEGIWALDTHRHNTEVSLGGLTYARVIEIINGYTVTFEDGQYAVNLSGANSNVGDNVNVNQVSVRTANSAGLISSPAIEYASFNGGVSVDLSSSYDGTVYPIGTPQQPVNNFDDALLIAEFRGFTDFYIYGNATVDNGGDFSGYVFIGESQTKTNLYIHPDANVNRCEFYDANVSGTLDGEAKLEDCFITDLVYINGVVQQCLLGQGTIYLGGNADAHFMDCWSGVAGFDTPVIDMGGSGQNLSLRNYNGGIKIQNMAGENNYAMLDINSGNVVIDSTCVSGTIVVRGVGTITDNSGPNLSVTTDALISKDLISQAVLNTPLVGFNVENSVAASLKLADYANMITIDTSTSHSGIAYPIGTLNYPVNNLDDAVLIANSLGFRKLNFLSDYTFEAGTYISNFDFYGQGAQQTSFTFEYGSVTAYCSCYDAYITGLSLGVTHVERCHEYNYGGSGLAPSDKTVYTFNTMFEGTVNIPSNYTGTMLVVDCWSQGIDESDAITVDFNGSACDLIVRNLNGTSKIVNCTNPDAHISYDFNSGFMILDSTVISGTIDIRGVGRIIDNSGTGASVNTDGLMAKDTISVAVWDEDIGDHLIDGTTGFAIGIGQFAGFVTVDTASGTAGTNFPIGTVATPVSNISDAAVIAEFRGFRDIKVIGDYTFEATDFISDLVLHGEGLQKSTFTFVDGCQLLNCQIKDAKVTGYDIGNIGFERVHMFNMSPSASAVSTKDAIIIDSMLEGESVIAYNWTGSLELQNCVGKNTVSGVPYTMNLNNGHHRVAFRNFSGDVRLTNGTHSDTEVEVFLNSGSVTLDSTCVSGTFNIAGVGTLTDNSGPNTIVNADGLMAKDTISVAVWDESVGEHLIDGTTGFATGIGQFNGYVTIDTVSGTSGTAFPIGTERVPVNNLSDAINIAETRGFHFLHVHENITFQPTDSVSDFTIIGAGHQRSTFTFIEGCELYGCIIEEATVSGIDTGVAGFNKVHMINMSPISTSVGSKNAVVTDSILEGLTTLASNWDGSLEVHNCFGKNTTIGVPYTLDLNGGHNDVAYRNFSGDIIFRNSTDSSIDVEVFMTSGSVELTDTIVSGTFTIAGVGTLVDNSGPNAVVNVGGLMSKETVSTAVWDENVGDHLIPGTTGFITGVSEFKSHVCIDTVSGTAGTVYPAGTELFPVNNLTDALTIAGFRGFHKICVRGDLTFQATDSLNNFIVTGEGPQKSTFTFVEGCELFDCIIEDASVTGVDTGIAGFYNVYMINMSPRSTSSGTKDAIIKDSLLEGVTILASSWDGSLEVENCFGKNTAIGVPYTMDLNGGHNDVAFRNFSGDVTFKNSTDSEIDVEVFMSSGNITIESTVVSGTFTIAGVGTLEDNSGPNAIINSDGLISKALVSEAVWDEPIENHIIEGTMGHEMYHDAYQHKVFIDTVGGTSSTAFPYGTREHPVNNLDDALTIAAAHNFDTVHIIGSLTVSGSYVLDGYTFTSDRSIGNTINMVEANTGNSYYDNLTIGGTFNGRVRLTYCFVNDVYNFSGGMRYCGSGGDVQFDSTDTSLNYIANHDTFLISGSDYSTIDLNGADAMFYVQQSQGNYLFSNKTSESLLYIGLHFGTVIIDSTCVSGTIVIEGEVGVTDNSGPNCNVVYSNTLTTSNITESVWSATTSGYPTTGTLGYDIAKKEDVASSSAEFIANAVWDEPLTAATHNVPTSAGRRLRQLSAVAVTEGTAVGPGNGYNQIQLNGDAWDTDGAYDPAMIAIIDGTGAGQCRNILEYNGSTKTATVDRNWKIQPTDDSGYVIYADAGREHVNEGLAVSGTLNTITLNAWASTDDDVYVGQAIFIRSGVGEDQSNVVSSYVGATKVATMEKDWTTIPNGTSAYVVLPSKLWPKEDIAQAVWDKPIAEHVLPATTGFVVGVSEFDKHVTINTVSGTAGTTYPIGTDRVPVNNLADAITIAETRGFDHIHIKDGYTFAATDSITNYTIFGDGHQKSTFVFEEGCQFYGCIIRDATVSGIDLGIVGFYDVHMINMSPSSLSSGSKDAIVRDSLLEGLSVLASNWAGTLEIENCFGKDSDDDTPYTMDLNGGYNDVAFRNFSGKVLFKNSTDANMTVDVFLNSGEVTIDSSNTAGIFNIAGVGTLIDNSTGTTVNSDGLVSKINVVDAVWDELASAHDTAGTMGEAMNNAASGGDLSSVTTTLSGIESDVDAIYNKLPSGNIAEFGEYTEDLSRILGLVQENQYLDQTVYTTYNGQKLLTSGRLRTYSDAASVGTTSNVVATYNITATWSGDEMQSYKVVKV